MTTRTLYFALLALIAAVTIVLFAVTTSSSDQATKFAVIGDYGEAGPMTQKVARLVKNWQPDFIVTVGDNNYEDGSAETIDENVGQYFHEYILNYRGRYGKGSHKGRFFPALGNHDYRTEGAVPYIEYFSLPGNERYYDFVMGDIHFFVLDSNIENPDGNTADSRQAKWLQEKLAASTSVWKIVYFHHAPYSSGKHGPETGMQWDFSGWGVTAVFSGHDHHYERLNVDGVLYFVNGLGGGGITEFKDVLPTSMMRYSENYGAMKVEATSKIIQFEFYNLDGVLIDSYSVYALTPPANLRTKTVSKDRVEIEWTDHSSAEEGFRIERSADGENFDPDGSSSANRVSFESRELQAGQDYFYRVASFRQNQRSHFSNVLRVTTLR